MTRTKPYDPSLYSKKSKRAFSGAFTGTLKWYENRLGEIHFSDKGSTHNIYGYSCDCHDKEKEVYLTKLERKFQKNYRELEFLNSEERKNLIINLLKQDRRVFECKKEKKYQKFCGLYLQT